MLGIKKIIFLALITVVVQLPRGGNLFAQAPLDFLVDVPTGCSPLVVSFIADSTQYHSFNWSFGDGSFSTLNAPQHIYSNAGNYTVGLIAVNNNGVADTIVKNNLITIQSSPSADFSISTNIVCEDDDEIIFTNLSSNYNSAYWDFGDGTGSAMGSPTHTYGVSGNYNVSLIVYDANGCFDSKDIVNAIQVNPKPSGLIIASVSATCDENELFNFAFSNSNVSIFNWSFGDGFHSSLPSASHVYGQVGHFNVDLITQNYFGCVDTSQLIGGINVKDNPKPTILVSDSVICLPDNISLSSNTSNIVSYNWICSNGFTSQAAVAAFGQTYADTINISLDVVYQNGCINSNAKTIIALPTPRPTYGIINSGGCAPLNVQLVNNTIGNYSWLWNFGDSTFSNLKNPGHQYNEAGVFVPILTATNSYGCSASWSTPGFIDVKKPQANFISNVQAGCEPLEVEFICTSTGIAQCQWDFGDGATSLNSNPVHTYNQVGNYDVTLIVTDINGCTDTLRMTDFIDVGVEDVQITSQTIYGCVPFNVQFSSQNTSGNHLWDFGDGTTSADVTPTHTFLHSGVYTVSYNFSSNSTNECSQTISEYATYIIGGGVPDFSVVQSECSPYTANFTDSSLNAVAWSWDFGDGNFSTDQNPSHIYSNPGNYNVSLSITSADGCTRTITKNYVVNFEPLIASPDANQLNTTMPMNVQFSANSTGATSWQWDFGDGNTSTLENPLHTYTIPGPYNLVLTISNDTCTRTLDYPSISLGGGSDPIPADSIVYSQSESFTGCVPYTIEFNSPVKNATSYLWLFGTGDSSIVANPIYVYDTPGTYDVILITQDATGMYDTVVNANAINLYALSASFTTENFIYCNSDSVIVLADDTLASNFEWSFGQGTIAYGSLASHVYNQADDYFISLRVSDSLGCEVFSNQLYTSGIHIEINSDKGNACVGDSIAFSSNYYPAFNYLWDFGDGNISSNVNPIHSYGQGGNYTVTLTLEDSTGCQFPVAENIQISVHEPIADFELNALRSNCDYVFYKFSNKSQNEVSWHWDFGDGITSNLENPGHNYMAFGTYDVTLTVSKYNCTSSYTDTAAVFHAELTADFNFLQDDKCRPSDVQFFNLSQNANTYSWQFGDGTFSNQYEPLHTYNDVYSDSIYLTATNAFGCEKTVAKPSVELMVNSFSVNESEGCAPFNVQFVNHSTGYDSLTWLLNDSVISNSVQPSLILESDGFYDVSLLLHSLDGCTDTLRKDSLLYVSNPMVSYAIDDTIVCKPGIVNFLNLCNNVDYYHWDFGDGASSVSSNPVHIYNENGNYPTSLIGVSNLGCSDTIHFELPIMVQGPDAKYMLASIGVCQPKSIWFNDSSTQANFWFWDFGDGHTSTEQHPIHHYSDAGIYNVSLIATDSAGCSSVFEYPNGVNIIDHPAINYSIDKTIGCVPLEINLSFPQNYSDSLLIDFGDGTFGSKNTTSHKYLMAGDYQIKFVRINEWGCIDTSYSDSIHVVLTPIAKFKVEDGIGCAPVNANIIDLSSSLSDASYMWNLGIDTSMLNTGMSLTYVNPASHTISLVITNEAYCSDTFKIENVIQAFENSSPNEVPVDFVSVVDKSKIEIQWMKDTDPGVEYYNLFRLNLKNGMYELLYNEKSVVKQSGSVINYFDNNLNTAKYKYDYKVQAVNFCDNKIPLDNISMHNSIRLKLDSISLNGIYLHWNEYKQCNIAGYEIYRADLSTGNFQLVNTVSNLETTYLDDDFTCPQPYLYVVKALELCGKSFFSESNTVLAEPIINLSNQNVEIVRSTVVDDNFILTEWNQPEFLPNLVTEYLVYRSIDNQSFTLVDRVPSYVTEFIDMDVEVDYDSYFYKIVPVNICDVEAKESNNSSSILLRAELEAEVTKLKWSKYTEWEHGVEKYVIERMDYNGNWQVIKVVDRNTFEIIE